MRYNKLIRDRVPDLIARTGGTTRTRQLAPAEFIIALREKLLEEAAECAAARTPDTIAEECADLLEVITALAEATGISWSQIAAVREQKARERGAFRDHLLLLETD
jgi:predicted house-cleaning noncanonical NTP pyrophosphatase (MazG superfamily)